jgi:hypothetical protein
MAALALAPAGYGAPMASRWWASPIKAEPGASPSCALLTASRSTIGRKDRSGPLTATNGTARPRICASQNPASVGTSSLAHRRAVDAKLIVALANHPGLSVVRLGELVGLSESPACIRLSKVAARGLTQSPQCAPGRSWLLTAAGRELVMSDAPVVLDELDRDLLRSVARSPVRPARLAAETGVCNLTVRRRLNALAANGMVEVDEGRFKVTHELGDEMATGTVGPRVARARNLITGDPKSNPLWDRAEGFRRAGAGAGALEAYWGKSPVAASIAAPAAAAPNLFNLILSQDEFA